MFAPNDDDIDPTPDVDQQIRINELKEQINEQTDGEMVFSEADDVDPNIAEQFWANVLAYEKAPWTSSAEQLDEAGFNAPHPDDMDDAALHAKLWEMIRALARQNTFVSCTDHLSDRRLYEELWFETLHEATKMPADLPGYEGKCYGSYHIDLVGSGSEEDWQLYLRYFADDDTREIEAREGNPVAPKEKPPYDRDRLLPQAPRPEDFDAPDEG